MNTFDIYILYIPIIVKAGSVRVDMDLSGLRGKLGNDARPFKNMTGFLTIQSLMQMDKVSL